MKLTTEQRKHLVTRTFTEYVGKVKCADVENETFPIIPFSVAGNFKDEDELSAYVKAQYRTITIFPVKIVEYEKKEKRYALYDYDFMKYGFVLDDEGEG